MYRMTRHRTLGFTLAELLISLAVLGVIATFTIPKVLQGQQNKQWNAAAKEAASTITAAYQAYQLDKGSLISIGNNQLFEYLNYVRLDTSSATLDGTYGNGSISCSSYRCFRLHNGGVLTASGTYMGDESEVVWFYFDPDGRYSGSTTGAGKSVLFFLYHNGRITSSDYIDSNSCFNNNAACYDPGDFADPPWFSW